MNFLGRLKNAYDGGGLREIVRKSFCHMVYRINNYKTKFLVDRAKFDYGLNATEERETKIIVSLTSFPLRFNKIHICLKSLLRQKVKPDKIIVYLGSDSSRDQFTKEMLALEQYGVEYHIDSERNLKAHKKYFYAMQEFPNDIIVTADDDLYYPSNWLSSLIKTYKKYPNAISARRVHLMKQKDGNLLPYNMWKDQCRSIVKPSFSLLATGGSGKLYPPHCLKECVFDDTRFKELCFDADDIWLKCMEIVSGIPVVWAKNWEVDQLGVGSNEKGALSKQNVDCSHNDVCLKNVLNFYNIPTSRFFG